MSLDFNIEVRYDGKDAEEHEIDLNELGKSAQGLAKIIATVADFSATGNYQKNLRNVSYKVSVKETHAKCFSLDLVIKSIESSPLLLQMIGGAGGGVGTIMFLTLLKIVWNYLTANDEEMDEVRKKAKEEIEKLEMPAVSPLHITVIERMIIDLNPAAKQAVSPIGNTCETMKFGSNKSYTTVLDIDDKNAIYKRDIQLTEDYDYRVLISEFDIKNSTCKISLVDDLHKRFPARIIDPEAENANNKYSLAMAAKQTVKITAKQKLEEGLIKEFIISSIEYELPSNLSQN